MARILIVDDEEADRLLGRTFLEDAGHQLFWAPEGEVAFRAFQDNDIDLVITDLVMPDVNGFALIERIRAEDGDALIIAVSGRIPEQLRRAEKLGASLTLRKPYEPAELLSAVTQVLSSTETRPPDGLFG